MRPCDTIIQAMFRIANKNAVTVDFILNYPQTVYSDASDVRDIILKARREGFSSYILAEFTTSCLVEPNTAAVVMSHEDKATQRHLARVHFYLKHLKGAEPVLKHQSTNLLSFPKTDSTFYIGTAGAKTFGRGDTITHLLLSEAAFYENPRAVVGGALQAASHAKRVIVETTANGYNWLKRQCDKAQKGRGKFKFHFFAWFMDPDNREPLTGDEDFDEDDLALMDMYPIDTEQLKWYVEKREEFMESDDDMDGLRLFKQEYPCSPTEAFQSSGAQYIGSFKYEELKPSVDGRLKVYKEVEDGKRYVIGGDISGGIGQDYFVAQVLDIDSLEQIATYRDHWTSPSAAAHVLERLGRRYNLAYIVPELNNHGYLTVDILKRIYPMVRIYQRLVPDAKARNKKRKTLGYITSFKSRFHMMDTLKLYLRRDLLVHDSETYNEMQALEEVEGKLQAPEGSFDDCVMALGLACVGVKKLVKHKIVTPTEEEKKINYKMPLMPYATLQDLALQNQEAWHEDGRSLWPH